MSKREKNVAVDLYSAVSSVPMKKRLFKIAAVNKKRAQHKIEMMEYLFRKGLNENTIHE